MRKPSLVGLLALVLALAPQATAAVPAPGAHAEAVADAAGGALDSASDDQPTTASANALSAGSDDAESQAEATVDGSVRSRSFTEGASGNNGPSTASATASWISNLTTAGIDPLVPVDIDVVLTVDGTLDYSNNNSGAAANQIFSEVGAVLRVTDSVGTTNSSTAPPASRR